MQLCMGIHPKSLEFLVWLRDWNDKKFFELYKELYQKIRLQFKDFTQSLIDKIALFDERLIWTEAKNCTFRIYRDTRFSKNKTPYKTNLWAYVAPGGKKSIFSWYYIHIEPGKSFFWWWIYFPNTQDSQKIREHIYNNFDEFKKIIENKEFKRIFGWLQLYRENRKVLPKVFQKNHPSWDFIIMKDWLVEKKLSDSEILSNQLENLVIEYAKILYPLNNFLNKSLI